MAESAPLKLRRALDHLKEARALVRSSKSPKAYDRIRAAISSTEGALRHARLKHDGPD
jgi:hypothetical protein